MSRHRKPDHDPRAEAACWFARANPASWTPNNKPLWKHGSEPMRNRREYEALGRVWEAARKIPPKDYASWRKSRAAEPQCKNRQYCGARLAYVSVIIVVITATYAARLWRQARQTFMSKFRNCAGEHKRITLPDSSSREMN